MEQSHHYCDLATGVELVATQVVEEVQTGHHPEAGVVVVEQSHHYLFPVVVVEEEA